MLQLGLDPPATSSPEADAGKRLPLGRLGEYELLEEIGRGGMGRVYRAHQVSLNRDVALKVISAGAFATPAMVGRFRVEAEAAAGMDHPNIVPVHEVGESGGQHFLSMRLVEGGTLAEWAERGRGSADRASQQARLKEAVGVVAKIARAADYAHQRGILHCDIKPGNILLGAGGEPYLSDFGLARALEGEGDVTMTIAVLGTPAYISPEQVAGTKRKLTTAVDIYGLGVVLYELLTGRVPFTGNTTMELLRKVVESDPPKPSATSPGVDQDLDTISMKCLEKEPEQRYRSAVELAEDLDRWMEGRPIEARPVQTGERLRKWVRRRPLAAALVGVSLLSLLIIGVGGTLFNLRLQEANREMVESAAHEHEALVRLTEDNGLRHFEKGDYFSALPWFVSALKLDAGNEPRELVHRRRIACALRSSPQLIHVWRHEVDASKALFSPDGRRILIVAKGGNRQLRLLDTSSGLDAHDPMVHETPIKRAVFNHDGTRIACACEDGAIWIWDAATGRPVVPALIDRSSAVFIGFSEDGQRLITASRGGIIKVRDAASGDEMMVKPQAFQVESAALDPSSMRIAIGTSEGKFQVLDLESGEKVFEAETSNKGSVRVLEYSASGAHLLALTGNDAEVFDAADGSLVSPSLGHDRRWIYDGVFDPSGTRVATCGRDGTARVRDFELGASPFAPLRHNHGVRRVVYSPLGDRILTCGDDRTAIFWSARTGERIGPPIRHRGRIVHVDFSRDGSMVLTTDSNETRLWALAEGLHAGPVISRSKIYRMKLDGDGRHVTVADGSNQVERYEVSSGMAVGDVSGIDPFKLPAAPCDNHLVRSWTSPLGDRKVVADENIASFHEPATGAKVGRLMVHRELIWLAKFSGDGSLLATASSDKSARVWDSASGKPITPPLFSETTVVNVDFSDSGDRLATSSNGEWISVWDLSPSRIPLDELETLSVLLSGRELDPQLGLIEGEVVADVSSLGGSRLPTPVERDTWIWNCVLDRSVNESHSVTIEIAKTLPGGGDLDRLRGRILANMGQSRLAIEGLRELGDSEGLEGDKGVLFGKMRRWADAEIHLRRAVDADPHRAAYWKYLANAQAGLDKMDLSLESRARAISTNPGSASLIEERGQTYVKMQRWEEAVADFRRAAVIRSKMLFSSVGEDSPIPPRGTEVPSACIDLSDYYNNSLDHYYLIEEIPDKNLKDIPRGLVEFESVPFDVRGAIRLTGSRTAPYMLPLPGAVLGIAIQRKCQRLHFLHTAHHKIPEGSNYGILAILFEDGRSETLFLSYGHHARDCYFSLPRPLEDPGSAAVWDAGQSFENGNPTLYRTTWENPYPDSKIVMIHCVSLQTAVSPILFAITAD